jgi:predicted RNase H-like nuclease
MVTTSLDEGAASTVDVVTDLSEVLQLLNAGELAAVAIDIPIGLPDSDPRPCDLAARKIIGPRASSVFPAPPRSVLGSASYEEACTRSRAACGKSMSRQAFAILPKVESVDRIMTRDLQDRFFEVHPELSFTMMAGRPMDHHKATPEGRAERLALLRREIADLDDHVHSRIPKSRPDDVLDAFAAGWSARRRLAGSHAQLGGELDGRGLRMEMIA